MSLHREIPSSVTCKQSLQEGEITPESISGSDIRTYPGDILLGVLGHRPWHAGSRAASWPATRFIQALREHDQAGTRSPSPPAPATPPGAHHAAGAGHSAADSGGPADITRDRGSSMGQGRTTRHGNSGRKGLSTTSATGSFPGCL